MTNIVREILFESSSRTQDATAFLSQSYKQILNLLSEYEFSKSIFDKSKIAKEICTGLLKNIHIEEEILHPAAKKALKEKGVISAVIMDQAILKYLVAEIESLDTDSDIYDIKISVLGEHLKEHILERQAKLFSRLNANGGINLWELGVQLVQYKEAQISNRSQSI